MTKLFISHAFEDKADFVEPLVSALQNADFSVWYDKYELTMGDSLLQKIGQGLRECDFGVVVLSHAFFRKKWTQAELDGLISLETVERKVILPVWKGVTEQDVKAFSPILGGRLGAPTEGGVDVVVSEIKRAVQAAERTASFSTVENALTRFKALDREVGGTQQANNLANSYEGVALASDFAKGLITNLRTSIEEMACSAAHLQIKLEKESPNLLAFAGSFRFQFVLSYENHVVNSIERAKLRLMIYQNLDPYGMDSSKRKDLIRWEFKPVFHYKGHLVWQAADTDKQFTVEQLKSRLLEDVVNAFEQLFRDNKRR